VPRKGYSRIADIPSALLHRLNQGVEETQTLAEGLAVDFAELLRAAAPEADCRQVQPSAGITRRMAQAGEALLAAYGPDALHQFQGHPSDTVRGWAAFALGATPGLTLGQRISRIRTLADDPHFGVREWAWLAIRPHVAARPLEAIELLAPWVIDPSPAIRRFAIEITRPRGVWCTHIDALKENPQPARVLLHPVRADPEKYVQDSVANWLNDASKSAGPWVRSLCDEWRRDSPTASTERICHRALRSLRKNLPSDKLKRSVGG
jgi:3-methyladenine DNA glycosylase AlkC